MPDYGKYSCNRFGLAFRRDRAVLQKLLAYFGREKLAGMDCNWHCWMMLLYVLQQFKTQFPVVFAGFFRKLVV